MSIKCELHQESNVNGVCHHCGKPVCNLIPLEPRKIDLSSRKNVLCGFIIDAPEFYNAGGDLEIRAVHCEQCLIKHHDEYDPLISQMKVRV